MADFGKSLMGKLDRAARGADQRLRAAVRRAGLAVAGQAQKNVTGGGSSTTMLNVRTGRLRSSISAVMVGPYAVAVGTNVVYGPIHEYGGEILPVRSKWLRFQTPDGQWHTVAKVRIPARPWLRPALEKMRAAVIQIIRSVYAGPLQIGGRAA